MVDAHPYGWLSLMPPVVAILLAIATRRVLPSLLAGLLFGACVTRGGNLVWALVDTLEIHLWSTIIDPGKLRTFSFTLLMGALVGVINRSGGMRGFVQLVAPWARTRRRAQLSAWFLGMLVFFDDYANTLLLGSTLRPLCDRLRISREKLAYLVDSTAAPVAGLALVSTWVAVEIDYINEGVLNGTAIDWNAFELFLASIPYRVYVWLALLFVPLVALFQRDFGPMLQAEQDCVSSQSSPLTDGDAQDVEPTDRWYNAVFPIVLTLLLVLILIVVTGRVSLGEGLDAAKWRDIFGAGDASLALQYGALAGLALAAAMARFQHILTYEQLIEAAGSGARVVLPAIAILWIASSLSRMTGNKPYVDLPVATVGIDAYPHRDHRLYTGEYVRQVLVNASQGEATSSHPGWWLPSLTFLLSAVVAFCTGTSWGTMGIVMPMAIPVTQAVFSAAGAELDVGHPVLLGSIAGVLAGAIFGDHCSPISDTTVLSSQASGCDHIGHVWTQMPYALVVASVSLLFGTLPIGYGVPWWLLVPLQIAVLIALLLLWGRPADSIKTRAEET